MRIPAQSLYSRTMTFLLLCVLVLVLPLFSPAAPERFEQQTDPDAQFQQAREWAYAGRREEARKLCRNILERHPGYHDVRVLLGRLSLWDGDYSTARKEFMAVLDDRPDHKDARLALIDTEYWSKNYPTALEYCNAGLSLYPEDQDLLLKKARILIGDRDYTGAAAAVNRILDRDPAHVEALQLQERIQSSTEVLRLSQRYRFDGVDRPGRDLLPWHLGSLEISRRFPWGSLIGRLNYAGRDFGGGIKTGTQFEVDAYPRFRPGVYAYLNIGYSADPIFPELRLGGELYTSLPHSFEMSAGIRHLNFSSSRVNIYTGALGKYSGNYWISIRPFITSKSSGTSYSGILLLRRYSGGADNYLGLFLGVGSSPIDIFYLEDIERIDSYKAGIEIKSVLHRALVLKAGVRFEREEYLPDRFGNRYTFELRLEERIFKKY